MAAAGGRAPWANSNSEEEVIIKKPVYDSRKENQLFNKIKFSVMRTLSRLNRSNIKELDYTITLLYTPTNSIHKCILNIIIPKNTEDDYNTRNVLFQIIKPGDYPCIAIEYDTESSIFHPNNSKIEQNSRASGEARCFHPAVPDGKGIMTDFLQILSTKIKRGIGSRQIQITDVALPAHSNLLLFTYRFMRNYDEPSIYQRYGYELLRPVYWQRLRNRLLTLTIPELRADIVLFPELFPGVIYDDAFKYPPREEEAAVIDYLISSYDTTIPIPELLKTITYEDDAKREISQVLFNRIRVFYYLWNYQAGTLKRSDTTEEILADLKLGKMKNILKKEDYSPLARMLTYEMPLLQLNPDSSSWKEAEQKLIITEIENGDTLNAEAEDGGGGAAMGGAGASASGGARRRRRNTKRKRRVSRRARKVDSGPGA